MSDNDPPIIHLSAPTNEPLLSQAESDSLTIPVSPKSPPRDLAADDLTSSQNFLPVPPGSPPSSNGTSQSSLSLSQALCAEELPADVAQADISISHDGTFIETSSGQAAFELKKRFDQQYGVGKEVRSPYAITSFVNQHGKTMYRVGFRDASAPAAAAAEAEHKVSFSSTVSRPCKEPEMAQSVPRRSRMSVYSLLPQRPHKTSHPPQQQQPLPPAGGSFSGPSGPPSSLHANNAQQYDPPAAAAGQPRAPQRKLQRARSIPDMFGLSVTDNHNHVNQSHGHGHGPGHGHPALPHPHATTGNHGYTVGGGDDGTAGLRLTGRTHSHSVTGADIARASLGVGVGVGAGAGGQHQHQHQHQKQGRGRGQTLPTAAGDNFAEMMNWKDGGAAGVGSPTSVSNSNSNSNSHSHSHSHLHYSVSSALDGTGFAGWEGFIINPFGNGVNFDSPSLPAGYSGSRGGGGGGGGERESVMPAPTRVLREMQSFESGLTARADDMGRNSVLDPGDEDMDVVTPVAEEAVTFGMDDRHEPKEDAEKGGEGSQHEGASSADEVSSEDPIASEDKSEHGAGSENGAADADAERDRSSVYDLNDEPAPDPVSVPDLAPLPATALHSRYSTEVFDVLQTYSGLPLLDKLVPDADDDDTAGGLFMSDAERAARGHRAVAGGETTIKMTLRADDSAAPRDDPRFVLWGTLLPPEGALGDADESSLEAGSRTGISSPTRSRRNTRTAKGGAEAAAAAVAAASDASGSHAGSHGGSGAGAGGGGHGGNGDGDGEGEGGAPRVLIAATIERWIAQLTSELNYDELLYFFLTYRTYISAVDLAHLLICRFHWSLERHETKSDEMVRRIVRVRTFVAIRYWLLTFFIMDFVPNRELRLLLGSWLNTLIRDPILTKHSDGVSIVKKLIKVVKDCKEAHTRQNRAHAHSLSQGGGGNGGTASTRQSISGPSIGGDMSARPSTTSIAGSTATGAGAGAGSKPRRTHVLGEQFAAAISKDADDSDVDLDFVADDDVSGSGAAQTKSVFHGGDASGSFSFGGAQGGMGVGMGMGMGMGSGGMGAGLTSPARGTTLLGQPLQTSMVSPPGPGGARGSVTGETLSAHGPAALMLPNGMLSRAFVKTINRLGRWRRVSNSRTAQPAQTLAVPANVSVFDLEMSAAGDLLTVRGGVGQYMKMMDGHAFETRDVEYPATLVEEQTSTSTSMDASLRASADETTLAEEDEAQASEADNGKASHLRAVTELSEDGHEADTDTRSISTVDTADSDARSMVANTNVNTRPEDDEHTLASQTKPKKLLKPRERSGSRRLEPTRESSARSLASFRTGSTDSFGSIISSASRLNPLVAQFKSANRPWQFDVVSIDDLDLSDTSSDAVHVSGQGSGQGAGNNGVSGGLGGQGLRKAPRKLPLRRDFEFVRRSRDSVSSLGIRSRDSVASESSRASSVTRDDGGDNGGGLGTGIQQWQMNALIDSLDDSDGDGGIEEALYRLEGQINPVKRRAKAKKVDGWVRTIRERMAAGDFGDERPRWLDEDSDEEEEDNEDFAYDRSETGSMRRLSQFEMPPPAVDTESGRDKEKDRDTMSSINSQSTIPASTTPASNHSSTSEGYFAVPATAKADGDSNGHINANSNANGHGAFAEAVGGPGAAGPLSPRHGADARPALEDVVPIEILQSRMPSAVFPTQTSPQVAPLPAPKQIGSPKAALGGGGSSGGGIGATQYHRSWILGLSAETIVQHFSMIDRELFLGVKPEELILDDWMAGADVPVSDWAQYLKDRARWKAESRFAQKTSALAALRARFNLLANFVISEVMLTAPGERHILVAKLIRVAFKAYVLSNFHTLVAIVAGLESEFVLRVMGRSWARVGMWEAQVFSKLKQFADVGNDFKAMHEALVAMVDAKPLTSHGSSTVSNATSETQGSKGKASGESKIPTACVPFIGLYLSRLVRHSRLPDLIDPTAPHEPVSVDPQAIAFEAPAHPEVFDALASLPPSMQLEPLINVHKQRLIANVIKDFVAGQHLASRVQFPVDKKLFQRCLRIRGLDHETLHRMCAEHDGHGRSFGVY